MSARDDYFMLVRMLEAMSSDDPDTIDVRLFDAEPINDALDEIDRLRDELGR